jgi:hypothetical protein
LNLPRETCTVSWNSETKDIERCSIAVQESAEDKVDIAVEQARKHASSHMEISKVRTIEQDK